MVPDHDPWSLQGPVDTIPLAGGVDHIDDAPRLPLDYDFSPPEVQKPVPKKAPEIMPSTTILAHGDGWTLFDNLYMYNGSLIIVSDEEESSFPEFRMITSTGKHPPSTSSSA